MHDEEVGRLATVLLLFAIGCGPKPDENSGGDQKKSKAGVIELGVPAQDRLDRAGGDSTDWKRVLQWTSTKQT